MPKHVRYVETSLFVAFFQVFLLGAPIPERAPSKRPMGQPKHIFGHQTTNPEIHGKFIFKSYAPHLDRPSKSQVATDPRKKKKPQRFLLHTKKKVRIFSFSNKNKMLTPGGRVR